MLPSAAEPLRQGFMRIVNHSDHAGDVSLTAIDDAGRSFGPLTMKLSAYQAAHFNSNDLEYGNEAKNLVAGIGQGQGDWRIVLETTLNVEVLAYIRTRDGLLTSVHDSVPMVDGRYRVAIFNPGSNARQASRLRLINPGEFDAEITIRGLDDSGASAGPVALTLPAGEAWSVSSRDLENGAARLTGALGDGDGKWRLEIEASQRIQVLSLMESPAGHITNLSSLTGDPADGLPLFLAAGSVRRQGFVRLINESPAAGEVEVTAFDTRGRMHGPVTLFLEPLQAVHFNADDLEMGNESKDIPKGIGNGRGDWRLRINSGLSITALAFVRTYDGFVTNVHDVAPTANALHRIPIFNPAGNTRQKSRLRLVNPGEVDADVAIGAWDDSGAPGGEIWLNLPARHAVSLSAQDLEAGTESLGGRFGDGVGKWRLFVKSSAAIQAMSLLYSPTAHVTNLSTSPGSGLISPPASSSCIGGVADADGDGVADHCDREPQTARRSLSGCSDGTHVDDPNQNARLVGDCRVLIGFANFQVQNADATVSESLRQWGSDGTGSIWGWDGINLGRDAVRVEGLFLFDSGLRGPIPPELAQLTELRWLNFSNNGLSGTIPPELGLMDKLETLFLGGNLLSGAIPPELGKLVALESLSFSNNRLTGPIPPELARLSNLRSLHLSGNQLTGPIPPALAQLTNLRTLWASSNWLSGPIPPELGHLPNLESLILFGNELSGFIPPELAELTNLRSLSFGENKLSGPLPVELSPFPNLRFLELNGNDLTGAIPAELSQLEILEDLNLADNQLSGQIPRELGDLTGLRKLWLANNRLSGAVPADLGRLTGLAVLDLSGNRLTGTIPRELLQLPEMLRLHLFNNPLDGIAPAPPLVFSTDPRQNGNASHHSVSYYQGPLGWDWNWRDAPVEHQRPIAGRRTAIAVRIDHESDQAPPVATRLLDAGGNVLKDRLFEAGLPTTNAVGQDQWRTTYVFDLPGELNQPGHRLIHTIDPDDEMPETYEGDNAGEPITLQGEAPPDFNITFVPMHRPGARPPSVIPSKLMFEPIWLLPVAEDYSAQVADAHVSDAVDKHEALDELRALWNAEADPDEFYYGICTFCGLGGVAERGGRVAVSAGFSYVVGHELGHNFGLQHAPCGTTNSLDPDYPYAGAELGAQNGWSFANFRDIGPADGYVDFMSYCEPWFISDYHFRKAANHWLGTRAGTGPSARSSWKVHIGSGTVSWGRAPMAAKSATVQTPQKRASDRAESLAVSGRVDPAGRWSLTHAQTSRKAPRSPGSYESHTLILQDQEGAELHREHLAIYPVSVGGGAGWAARVPLPPIPAAVVLIVDAQGETVMRQELNDLN
ncbi:MAG: M66 family metalloprotease [Rhodospirillaceae bacterium]|nr:M66 family metalloprotease [Rhodospirillaceae bacterium]